MEPCTLDDLPAWFERQLTTLYAHERSVLQLVASRIDDFLLWPDKPLLLWEGCDRIRPAKGKQRYHTFPNPIKDLAREWKYVLDGRANGPAIAAFMLSGGDRIIRNGTNNKWSIHHIYNNKFPYQPGTRTLHAVKERRHFTQSAGLVAVHPIADAIADEFAAFAWLLRATAWKKFHYDPDGVFTNERNEYGFAVGHPCKVFYRDEDASC